MEIQKVKQRCLSMEARWHIVKKIPPWTIFTVFPLRITWHDMTFKAFILSTKLVSHLLKSGLNEENVNSVSTFSWLLTAELQQYNTQHWLMIGDVWPMKLRLEWFQISLSSLHWVWKVNHNFNFTISEALLWNMQCNLKRKLTVIVFQAVANKRHQRFVNNEEQFTVFALHQMVGDSRWAARAESKWDLSQGIKRERSAGNQRKNDVLKKRWEWSGFLCVCVNPESLWEKVLVPLSLGTRCPSRTCEQTFTHFEAGEDLDYFSCW